MFTTRLVDCHFNETFFLTLGGETKQLAKEINLNELSLSYHDPYMKQCKQEVQKIIHLQNLVNQLSNVFTDPKRVTKSHIPATNVHTRIVVPEGQPITANEIK